MHCPWVHIHNTRNSTLRSTMVYSVCIKIHIASTSLLYDLWFHNPMWLKWICLCKYVACDSVKSEAESEFSPHSRFRKLWMKLDRKLLKALRATMAKMRVTLQSGIALCLRYGTRHHVLLFSDIIIPNNSNPCLQPTTYASMFFLLLFFS